MSNRDTILPDSVAIFQNIAAFDLAAKSWLDGLQIDLLLIYAIDRVDSKALPLLAEQFDVLGYKGWKLCESDTERRSLIKRAVELHRFKGTPWAIKQALKSIGFQNVVIEEHTSGHWAKFKVHIDNNQVTLTPAVISDVNALVEEYKNARSVLDGILMTLVVEDEIDMSEQEVGISSQLRVEDAITINSGLFYDGADDYDGEWDHSGDGDIVIIT